MLRIFFIFIWILLAFINGRSATYYADAVVGDDNFNGLSPVPSGGNVGPKKTITAASALATNGDVVEVAAGTYAESLQIPVSITLRGPNAAISPNGGARLPEAVLAPTQSYAIGIGLATSVTFVGFTLKNTNSIGIVCANPLSSFRGEKNIIQGPGPDGGSPAGFNFFAGQKEVYFEDNLFRNITGDNLIAIQANSCDKVTILNNVFNNIDYAGVMVDGTTEGCLIKGNKFSTIMRQAVQISEATRPVSGTVEINENSISDANLSNEADKGGIRLQGTAANYAGASIRILYNEISNAFNGIAIGNGSTFNGVDLKIHYNLFKNNLNAAFYHGGTGQIDARANFWNDPTGPLDDSNLGGSGSPLLETVDNDVRYAPWLGTSTDADVSQAGWQYPSPVVYVLKKSVPASGLLQAANDFAADGDEVHFYETDFPTEDVLLTKNLTFYSTFNPIIRNVTLSGENVPKTLIFASNFTAQNITLTTNGGGKILTGGNILAFTGTITEAPGKYVIGILQTIRSVGTGASNFGNIGFDLGPGADDLALVTITRQTGPGTSEIVFGQETINRKWFTQVSGTDTPSPRTLTLSWLSDDDNGNQLLNMLTANNLSGVWAAVGTPQDVTGTGDPRKTTVSIDVMGELIVVNDSQCFNLVADAGPASLTVCPVTGKPIGGTPAVIGGTGPYTYLWSPALDLGSDTVPNPNAGPTSLTTYTLRVTDVHNCTAVDSIVVSPIIDLIADAGASQSVCSGQTATLSGSAAGGSAPYLYSWQPTTGMTGENTQTPSIVLNGTTTFTLSVTDGNGCVVTDTVTLTALALPPAYAGSDKTVCALQPTQLTAIGGVSYSWTPTPYLDAPNIANPTATISDTTTFTVTVTDAKGCVAQDAVTINILALPVVTIDVSPVAAVCEGKPIQLNASGGVVYSWAPAWALDAFNIPNPIATPAASIVYTVTVTGENNCKNQKTVELTILDRPTLFMPADLSVCLKDSAFLNVISNGESFNWQPIFGLNNPNIKNPLVKPTQIQTYTLNVVGTNGCIASDTIRVVVKPNPTADAGADESICNGTSVPLNGSGGDTYKWSPFLGLSNPNSPNPLASPTFTTNYALTVTNAEGCIATDTVRVTVRPTPVANAGVDKNLCIYGAYTLTGGGIGASYDWNPESFLSDATSATPTFTATTITSITYTLTVSNEQGCADTDEVTINVLPRPTIKAGADQTICPGQSAFLNATGGISYSWFPSNGLSHPNSGATQASPAQTTTYNVIGTGANGCTDTASVTVHVVPEAAPEVIPMGTVSLCANSFVSLSTTAVGVALQWYRNGLPIPNANTPTLTVTQSGNYMVETDNNGCKAQSVAVLVIVQPGAFAYAGMDAIYCAGGSGLQLNATGGETYAWSPPNGLSDPNSPTPIASPTASQTYTLTVTDVTGCTDTDEVTISVVSPPTITAFANGATTICEGTTTQLVAQPSSPNLYLQWKKDGVEIPGAIGITLITGSAGSYTVEATSSAGCVAISPNPIVITTLPPPNANAGPDLIVCSEKNIPLQASGGQSYVWTPTTSLNDASVYNPIFNGAFTVTYTVTVTNGAGCSASDTLIVRVTPFEDLPTPVINPSGSITGCSADSVRLQTSNGLGYHYKWYRNGQLIAGAHTSGYVTPTSGSYAVSVSVLGCEAKTSEPTKVTLRPSPLVSVAIQNPTCETCTDGSVTISATDGVEPYKYALDAPPFGVQTQFTNLSSGDYTALVKDAEGCVGKRAFSLVGGAVGRDDVKQTPTFRIYPNPSEGLITLEFAYAIDNAAMIKLININGQIVYKSNYILEATNKINFPENLKGLFYLEIFYKNKTLGQKIILR